VTRRRRDPELLAVPRPEFEAMVTEAMDGLPPALGTLLRNVVVLVDDEPPQPGLLGLYEGVPLTARGTTYAGVLPDRITIYRLPLCRLCRDEDELRHEVGVTVVHEVAHHFGIGDDRLRELGW